MTLDTYTRRIEDEPTSTSRAEARRHRDTNEFCCVGKSLRGWRPARVSPVTREGDALKRRRSLRILGATEAQAYEGGRDDRRYRRIRGELLRARSARVQATAGWAERPCPCTLLEARVCPVHEAERVAL